MRVESSHPLYRSVGLATHLRARLLDNLYGVQGTFVRRWAFEAISEFRRPRRWMT
jgi:hypothetical protein